MKKQISKLLALYTVILMFFTSSTALAFSQHVTVKAMNTVAGYSVTLTSSPYLGNQSMAFYVKKPDGLGTFFSAKTDRNGVAKIDLPQSFTTKAGQYFASVLVNGSQGPESSFRVFPGQVSAKKSTVTLNRTVLQNNGNDAANISVKLVDTFGNAYPGHSVTIVSSRYRDMIKNSTPGGVTDKNGVANFTLSANDRGVSTITAIDSTANVVLDERPQVAFLSSQQYLADIGGDFNLFDIAYASDFGALSQFKISDLPANIQVGQNVSFKITALDDLNQTIQNYTGTVHFSAEGDNSNNVSLPEDYTFKAEDLGSHQFSLGLSFTANGTYKILVSDKNDALIKGSYIVNVGNIAPGSQQGSIKPIITSPAAGTFSQNNLAISGSAPASYTVKIFDNGKEMGTVQADNSGKFTYQTIPLIDGQHNIYVVAIDQNQAVKGTSDTIQVTIDTTAPELDEVSLNPTDNVKPGQAIKIDVLSEENLSQAAAVFQNDIIALNSSIDKPGHYIGSVQAPNTPGAYPIDVILVDQLGNQGSFKAKAQVVVTNGDAINSETQTQITQESKPVEGLPGRVSGLISYVGDKKVTLTWNATTSENPVMHYRVYYGNSAANLESYADTKDASTTWYVPNLENGKQYYFAVTAFNNAGESSIKSDIVSGIPLASEVGSLPAATGQIANNQDMHASAADYYSMPEQQAYGPEVLWLLAGSGIAPAAMKKLRKLLKK